MTKRTFSSDEAREIAAAIGIDWGSVQFALEDFRAGMDVELEHGRRDGDTNVTEDDPITTGKIALAHLRELPDYYTRLEKMEKGAGHTQLRLLVTLDGSALGDEVIAHALKLARATTAEVRLFSVLAEKDLPYLSQRPLSDGTLPKRGERADEARHRLTAEIQVRMTEVASSFEDAGVKVSVDIDNGDPAELIIDAARAFGSDLIMMATHGHSGIVEQLLGSVSATVVKSGVAPVVLVRPQKAAST